MDELTAAGRAAARLLEERSRLARVVTDAMYAEDPSLLERFGAVGRERCLEDLHFTIEHLTPAVDLGEPELFTGYVRWLEALLRAREVSARHVLRSLELVEREVRASFPEDEAHVVSAVVRAGAGVLPRDAA